MFGLVCYGLFRLSIARIRVSREKRQEWTAVAAREGQSEEGTFFQVAGPVRMKSGGALKKGVQTSFICLCHGRW